MPSGYSSIIGNTLSPRPLLNTSISVSPETRNFKKLTRLYLQVWKTLSGASGKCLVELGKPYKETCDGDQVEKVDSGRAIGD